MANTPTSLDKWREYFRGANSDIFDIIEHAIMVAASDCPYDFKLHRDRIAEMLFTCKTTKCFGCDRIELVLPIANGVEKSDDKYKNGVEAGGSKDTKESKVNSWRDDDDHVEVMEMNGNHQVSNNYSYGDAKALTDEIDEEFQFFGEVLRIKETIDNGDGESDDLLFDALRKLQLMPLSVETLKTTKIGKSVNALRKHKSKEMRNLVRALIEEWKVMVDAWAEASTAVAAGAEVTSESGKTCAVEEEEEGLPSPPLDEGAFFTTSISMELSQFFDGMDDDGNPRNCREYNKNRDNGRKPNLVQTNVPKWKLESPDDLRTPLKDIKPESKKNQETMLKKTLPSKPNRHPGGEFGMGHMKPPSGGSGPGRPKSSGGSGPGRPKPSGGSDPCRPKPMVHPKANNDVKVQQKPDNKVTVQKKPAPPQQEKLDCNNAASVRMKLEAAKRKLQERYQKAENAKKQRTIQVVEFQDLPKQSVPQRNHRNMRGDNRHEANGRH